MNKNYARWLLAEHQKLVCFNPEKHRYYYYDKTALESVTNMVKKYKTPFDKQAIATKCNQNPKSEYYNIPVREIIERWETIGDEACKKGTQFHRLAEFVVNDMEQCLPQEERINHTEPILRVMGLLGDHPYLQDTFLATEVILQHKSLKIAGTVDLLCLNGNGTISVYDWKTNQKSIHPRMPNYGKLMQFPFSSFNDTEYYSYSLQLSFYAYMLEEIGFKVQDLNILQDLPEENKIKVIKCTNMKKLIKLL